jgi:hypothetical protein
MSYRTRRSHYQLVCALSLWCAACSTETHSLTHTTASLEEFPNSGPIFFSDVRGGESDMDAFEVRWNGQPVLHENGDPVALESPTLSLFMPAGSGTIELVRDGDVVLKSKPIEIARDRYTYVIAYGDRDAPELMVQNDTPEARRVRISNVRKDATEIEFAYVDANDEPLGDTMSIAYGETYSGLAGPDADKVRLIGADGAMAQLGINCNPTFHLVLYDYPQTLEDSEQNPSRVGPWAVTMPGSREDAAAQCFDHACRCDGPSN